MPPKPKFTRQEIVSGALSVVSEKGVEALTARELAHHLGCSTRPIFTVFSDMDELKAEVRRVAAQHIERSAGEAMDLANSFIDAESRSIRFAMQEPNLYRLVFLSGSGVQDNFDDVLADTEVSIKRYAEFMCERYGLTTVEAFELFRHTWIYTYGMGTLCAMQRYVFADDELEQLLKDDFWGTVEHIKASRASGGSAGGEAGDMPSAS